MVATIFKDEFVELPALVLAAVLARRLATTWLGGHRWFPTGSLQTGTHHGLPALEFCCLDLLRLGRFLDLR